MKYNVILKKGAKEVLNIWVSAFVAAQNTVISHLAADRKRNEATIIDAGSGEYRHYFFIGDKLNISII